MFYKSQISKVALLSSHLHWLSNQTPKNVFNKATNQRFSALKTTEIFLTRQAKLPTRDQDTASLSR